MRSHLFSALALLPFTISAAFAQSTAAPPDVKAPPADAVKTESGLATKVIRPGKGTTRPDRQDMVTVHYTGWTTDGKMFDTSRNGAQPVMFPLDRVIAGWTEGVQLMVEGEVRRFWIPESLAYQGRREPRGMLVFDVELIGFRDSPTVPPPDVKGPPADAKVTATGIAYKVLKPGTGVRRPVAASTVTVHYSGWTVDGKLFDSSELRGEPASFALNEVIAGWTEGVQLMVPGERTRFWIPEKLAYRGERAPFGMLVFEIELLEVK
jgi:FKBP-type peptidyl-prolyl cis-trans isomerase